MVDDLVRMANGFREGCIMQAPESIFSSFHVRLTLGGHIVGEFTD